MRRRPPSIARKDANHDEIVGYFERLGWSVADLANVGRGIPDLLVGGVHPELGRIMVLVEVKTDKGKLRANQIEFAQLWRGRPVEVARDLADVLRICGREERQT